MSMPIQGSLWRFLNLNNGKTNMKATYIEVSAGVRYWEDAAVDCVEDADGSLIPMRKGDNWEPVIRLADGAIMEWPDGVTADVHYKVCDAGEYWLLDDERRRVAKWAGFYVPNDFLCHGDNGYGDYIIFKVGPDGLIEGWIQPVIETVCECDDSAQRGWKKLNNADQA